MAKNNKKNRKAANAAAKVAAKSTKPVETASVEAKPVEVVKEEKPVVQQVSKEPIKTAPPKEEKKPVDTKTKPSVPTPNSEKKEEKKPEVKVEEKKPKEAKKSETKKPEVKVTTAKAEVVGSKINTLASGLGKIADGERMSPDSAVALMGIIERNYKGNPSTPPQLTNGMAKVFDMMAINSVMVWAHQFSNDVGEVGIKVNPEIFSMMEQGFAEYLGVTLKALPTKDGQMTIAFKESMETAPQDVKEAIVAEESIDNVEELPAFVSGKSEDDYLLEIRKILGMRSGSATMQSNVTNAIEFGKKAFNMKDAEPAQVLATIIKKLGTESGTLLNGCARAVYGTLMGTQTPFGPQSWLKEKIFPNLEDKKIANVAKVLMSYAMKLDSNKTGADYSKKYLQPWSILLSSMNDDIINKIIADVNEETPKGVIMMKDEKTPLSIEGLSMDSIPSVKTINYIKTAYGAGMDAKLLKSQMQKISALYTTPLSPLEDYAEKSAYAIKL